MSESHTDHKDAIEPEITEQGLQTEPGALSRSPPLLTADSTILPQYEEEKDKEVRKKPKASMCKMLGLNNSFCCSRTEFCQHDFGCFENIIRGTLRSFSIGYGIKAGISLIGLLVGFKKLLKKPSLLPKALLAKSNLKMGLFLGTFTFLVKATICSMRRIRKDDSSANYLVAGALAGFFSLFFQDKSSRSMWALFLLARAFDCFYNLLCQKGIIKRSKYHYVILFSVLNSVTGYAFAHEPSILPKALDKFYKQMTDMSENDKILKEIWTERTNRRLRARGLE